MAPLRIALAQMLPDLERWPRICELHHELIKDAREATADLLVFPELGLTGYLLQDLNAEVAMRRDDPRLLELAEAAGDMSAVVSFVEESEDHTPLHRAALLEGGRATCAPQGLPADLRPLR